MTEQRQWWSGKYFRPMWNFFTELLRIKDESQEFEFPPPPPDKEESGDDERAA